MDYLMGGDGCLLNCQIELQNLKGELISNHELECLFLGDGIYGKGGAIFLCSKEML